LLFDSGAPHGIREPRSSAVSSTPWRREPTGSPPCSPPSRVSPDSSPDSC